MASSGETVVFFDDFIGSGDQFIKTWSMKRTNGSSFADALMSTSFNAIYVALVGTEWGVARIRTALPRVTVSVAHVLDGSSTVRAIDKHPGLPGVNLETEIPLFLAKYAPRLRFLEADAYMMKMTNWPLYGYHDRGLLFAFEHSVPDATLPIFWAGGDADWTPLLERR